jgi:tRNA G37 N-methylase Trm5
MCIGYHVLERHRTSYDKYGEIVHIDISDEYQSQVAEALFDLDRYDEALATIFVCEGREHKTRRNVANEKAGAKEANFEGR